MAPKKSKALDKDAADRVRQAAIDAASAPLDPPPAKDGEEASVSEALVDSLGRPIVHESFKERVAKFNDFTGHLRSKHNTRVSQVFMGFTFAMFTLPVIVYVLVFNAVLPAFGDVRIAPPLMEDDDGNIVPDLEWTDPATMGAAHTVVTLWGLDRSLWAGAAAVVTVLALKAAFVLVSFRLDAQLDAATKGGPKQGGGAAGAGARKQKPKTR